MSDVAPDLATRLFARIRQMPAGHARPLAAAVAPFPACSEEVRARALDALAHRTYRQHANEILKIWSELADCSGRAFALAIHTAVVAREYERSVETTEVVATGPASPHVAVRHMRAVLLDLISRARRELIVVSYAAYRVDDIAAVLARASGRGVAVRLILETAADSSGALTHDGAAALEAWHAAVQMYVWPAEKRPGGGRLHAKVVLADAEWAFITSANLTGHALDQNLEVGALVHGGEVPRRLTQHFNALIALGTLRRVQ